MQIGNNPIRSRRGELTQRKHKNESQRNRIWHLERWTYAFEREIGERRALWDTSSDNMVREWPLKYWICKEADAALPASQQNPREFQRKETGWTVEELAAEKAYWEDTLALCRHMKFTSKHMADLFPKTHTEKKFFEDFYNEPQNQMSPPDRRGRSGRTPEPSPQP